MSRRLSTAPAKNRDVVQVEVRDESQVLYSETSRQGTLWAATDSLTGKLYDSVYLLAE
jgi:hypothetical protein